MDQTRLETLVDPIISGTRNSEVETKLTDQDEMLSRLGQHGKNVSLHNLLKCDKKSTHIRGIQHRWNTGESSG